MRGKRLSLTDLTMLGVGSIIGSGIFAMVGIGIDLTGKAVSLALVLGAFVNLIMCAPIVLVASLTDVEGGIYGVARTLLGPRWGGVFGLLQVMSNCIVAIYCLAMAAYVAQLFPALAEYERLIAGLILTGFFLTTLSGTKNLARLQGVMVIVMLLALAVFVAYGLGRVEPGYFTEGYFDNNIVGFVTATAVLTFASTGANLLVNFYEVTDNPRRNFPLALVISTVIVALVYFLIGIVASGVLPLAETAGQPLSVVAQVVLSDTLFIFFVAGGAFLALASTLNNTLAMIPFPTLALTRDGHLPRALLRTSASGYPWLVMLALFAIGLLPIVTGLDIEEIVSIVFGPSFLLASVFAFAAVRLPRRYPDAWRESALYMPQWLLLVVCTVSALTFAATGAILVMNLSPALQVASALFGVVGIIYAFLYREERSGSGRTSH